MTKSLTCFVLGTGFGFLLVIGGQKVTNAGAALTCKRMPNYHRLVTFQSFIGDSKQCMHIRYLAQ